SELLHVPVRLKHPQRQSVCFSQSVKVIRRRETTGARHVLNNHVRIARDVLRHMLGEEPSPEVIEAATVAPDNDANGLSLVKSWILRIRNISDPLPTPHKQGQGKNRNTQNQGETHHRDERDLVSHVNSP